MNNECVIATTWNDRAMDKIKAWVETMAYDDYLLFTFTSNKNTETLFLAPDGKDCDIANQGEALRKQLIDLIKTFNYTDGSNPFYYVEVAYGEHGQKVLSGNCKNLYDDLT